MQPIIDLRRLRGTLIVAALLGGFLAVINFAVLAIAGPEPGGAKSRRAPLAFNVREEGEERVAGLAELDRGRRFAEKPFLLYVGLSSCGEDIDPQGLSANDGWNAGVAGLCGKGGGIEGLLDLTEPIVRRRLRPSLVVLCMHICWLADPPPGQGPSFDYTPGQPPPSLNPLPVLRRGNWNEALDRVAWWNWISKNSMYINRFEVSRLLSARTTLDLFPTIDPWSPPQRAGNAFHASAATLHFIWSSWELWGAFDLRDYVRKESERATAYHELIARFRNIGSPLVVVLMPEMAAFRSHVPAEARQVFIDSTEQGSRASAIPVLDFRDAIHDENFADYVHLNDVGRPIFTRLLAQAIRDWRSGKSTANIAH